MPAKNPPQTTAISLDFSDVYVKWNGSYGIDDLPAGYVLEWDDANKLAEITAEGSLSHYSSHYLIMSSGTQYDLEWMETFFRIVLMTDEGVVQTLDLPQEKARGLRVNRSRQTYGNGPERSV